MKISKEEIKRLILEEDLIIEDVLDVIIELNAIIGVGLLDLIKIITDHIKLKL